MNIEILEKKDKLLVVILSEISLEMVNSIRRIMMSEIPVMAIDEVIILKNDSPLYDEIVAHRLGMIPLRTDLDKYNLPHSCTCGGYGCPLCQVSLTCEITNTTNKPIVIYSGDLHSNDPNVIPVDPNIPIVKIDKNNKVILEAYAVLGTTKSHVKWQAVSNCAYRYYPIIEFNANEMKDEEQNKNIVKMCPEKLFEISNKKLKLKEDYWKTCTLCESCKDNSDGKIQMSWKENTYIFSIESDGVLPFDVVIKKTFEIFLEKINEFVTKLEGLKLD
jgi:DNA-directed RNA polymerase subunit D